MLFEEAGTISRLWENAEVRYTKDGAASALAPTRYGVLLRLIEGR